VRTGVLSREDIYEALLRRQYVDSIDPDIYEARSFSTVAKVRMQRERNARRQLEYELGENVGARVWDSLRAKVIGI